MNQMDGTNYGEGEVICDIDLCEGCGEVKLCVMGLGGKGFFSRMFDFFGGVFDMGE